MHSHYQKFVTRFPGECFGLLPNVPCRSTIQGKVKTFAEESTRTVQWCSSWTSRTREYVDGLRYDHFNGRDKNTLQPCRPSHDSIRNDCQYNHHNGESDDSVENPTSSEALGHIFFALIRDDELARSLLTGHEQSLLVRTDVSVAGPDTAIDVRFCIHWEYRFGQSCLDEPSLSPQRPMCLAFSRAAAVHRNPSRSVPAPGSLC